MKRPIAMFSGTGRAVPKKIMTNHDFVAIGIDTAVPDRVLQMPPCDMRDPSALPHDAKPYLKLAPSSQFVSVELTYRDGSVSEIKSFRR